MTHYSLGFAIVRQLAAHAGQGERGALARLADGAGSADDLRVAFRLAARVDAGLAAFIVDAAPEAAQ